MSYVLGLDLGTGSLKGILVNKEGKIVDEASADYPLLTPKRGYSEQDPKEWFRAAKEVMAEIFKSTLDVKDNLEGISFSGQMHSLVLLDEKDDVLRNAILWNDVRTTEQCVTITEKIDNLIAITKNKALEGFTLPKLLWVKENEPAIWAKVATFLLPKDYLGFCLTGSKQMEYSDAAGTLLLDVEAREWSKEIAEKLAVPSSLFPRLIQSQDKIGDLDADLAEELGLLNSVPVFSGGADNPCAAVGAGIVRPDQGMASIGTSGVFLSYEETGDKNYNGHLHYFNHVVPNAFYTMGVTLAAGNSLSWFKQTFAPNESFEELLKGVKDIKPGSDGLLFAPYISGERTPYTDSNIRGTFLGMDIAHTRDHFARAVLEGITFSLRDSFELMKKHSNKDFKQIVSVGGGAKNPDWLQMQADIFNTPVVTLETEQGPAMGSAMIAAVGAGWFDSFADCSKVFVNYKSEVQPDAEAALQYDKVYANYKEVYPTIKDLSHKLVTAND
ncbi:xylulokinase [Alkalibacterium sp. 20]|uniref:xylulokinase n=1 Tax=Alkalibacterium sp. 20 TaxID=1798803 RepID=UPI0008FFF942|nr:xylulokinase [Alkalibacterium sp. 20]OJF93907.1 xylulose kinase [Alkalibacterium sp. 20]